MVEKREKFPIRTVFVVPVWVWMTQQKPYRWLTRWNASCGGHQKWLDLDFLIFYFLSESSLLCPTDKTYFIKCWSMLFKFFFKKKNYVYLFFVVFRDIIVTKESIRELETAPETETRWLDRPRSQSSRKTARHAREKNPDTTDSFLDGEGKRAVSITSTLLRKNM